MIIVKFKVSKTFWWYITRPFIWALSKVKPSFSEETKQRILWNINRFPILKIKTDNRKEQLIYWLPK